MNLHNAWLCIRNNFSITWLKQLSNSVTQTPWESAWKPLTTRESRSFVGWPSQANLAKWSEDRLPGISALAASVLIGSSPLLLRDLDKAYPYFQQAPRPFVEALLLPWGVQGGPEGTLWVVAHTDRRNFDLQDVRMMGSLAAFAFGAIYVQRKMQDAERVSAAISMTSEMAHHINNPLQAAMLLLFRLKSENVLSDAALDLLTRLEIEVDRVAKLSAEIINGNRAAHAA